VRALDCSCGQHLEADNDKELFKRAREHVDADHPGMELSDEKVRHIVDRGAYEK
jgi:predicted small metal-binding protein